MSKLQRARVMTVAVACAVAGGVAAAPASADVYLNYYPQETRTVPPNTNFEAVAVLTNDSPTPETVTVTTSGAFTVAAAPTGCSGSSCTVTVAGQGDQDGNDVRHLKWTFNSGAVGSGKTQTFTMGSQSQTLTVNVQEGASPPPPVTVPPPPPPPPAPGPPPPPPSGGEGERPSEQGESGGSGGSGGPGGSGGVVTGPCRTSANRLETRRSLGGYRLVFRRIFASTSLFKAGPSYPVGITASRVRGVRRTVSLRGATWLVEGTTITTSGSGRTTFGGLIRTARLRPGTHVLRVSVRYRALNAAGRPTGRTLTKRFKFRFGIC